VNSYITHYIFDKCSEFFDLEGKKIKERELLVERRENMPCKREEKR